MNDQTRKQSSGEDAAFEGLYTMLQKAVPDKTGELAGKAVGKSRILTPLVDRIVLNYAPKLIGSAFYTRLLRPSALLFTAFTLYDFFAQAAAAAERLKAINPEIYQNAYKHGVEMLYFVLEPNIGRYIELASRYPSLTEKEKHILREEIEYISSGIRKRTDLYDKYGDY